MSRRKSLARRLAFALEPIDDPVEALIAQARRSRRRGEERRALGLLRQACAMDEWRSRPSALLGAWLLEAGAASEAKQRLRHARWLLERAGDVGRARSLDALVAAAERAA